MYGGKAIFAATVLDGRTSEGDHMWTGSGNPPTIIPTARRCRHNRNAGPTIRAATEHRAGSFGRAPSAGPEGHAATLATAGYRPDWTSAQIDLDAPSPSRVYDALLGGSHNFKADRDAAQQLIAVQPHAAAYARANRSFLHRAVRHLVAAGVRQFLDIGSGIPTMGNVHEIAQARDPSVRVVYVDVDPVAVAHSQELLTANARAAAIHADVRDPDSILDSPEFRDLIDLRQPVAILLVAVLHFIHDADDPAGIVARLCAGTVPGSFLVISHASPPSGTDSHTAAVEMYRQHVAGLRLRRLQQVAALFDGFRLTPPGLVSPEQWRPESEPGVGGGTPAVAGVGVRTDLAATRPHSATTRGLGWSW